MKQYAYDIISPSGNAYTVYCTAAKPEWARLQVCMAYKGWTVCELFCDVNKAHHVFTEIDASRMSQADYDYFVSKV